MLTIGASATDAPLVFCSAPSTLPYPRTSPVSQVAAAATGAGSWVTWDRPPATPFGPSWRAIDGTHSRLIAGTRPAKGLPLPFPCTMRIFSSNVIWARTWFALANGAALEPTHGQLAAARPASAGATTARVDAMTASDMTAAPRWSRCGRFGEG